MAKDKSKVNKKDKADKDEVKKKKAKVSKKSKTQKENLKKIAKKAKATMKSKAGKAKKKISPEERIEMIRTAAYYLAEKRNYHGSHELDDWIEAEKEIDTIS
jgi:hypothetical protein